MRVAPILNGQVTPLEVEPQELLLDVLRDRLDSHRGQAFL